MEASDHERILELSKSNFLLRKLYEEHQELEDVLAGYAKRVYLTPDEELEERRLKKKKLLGVDRMMQIINRPFTQSQVAQAHMEHGVAA